MRKERSDKGKGAKRKKDFLSVRKKAAAADAEWLGMKGELGVWYEGFGCEKRDTKWYSQ